MSDKCAPKFCVIQRRTKHHDPTVSGVVPFPPMKSGIQLKEAYPEGVRVEIDRTGRASSWMHLKFF
jgi:hypothetical protein